MNINLVCQLEAHKILFFFFFFLFSIHPEIIISVKGNDGSNQRAPGSVKGNKEFQNLVSSVSYDAWLLLGNHGVYSLPLT